MFDLQKGKYRARLARTPEDVALAQALRSRAFLGEGRGADTDAYDQHCAHVLVENVATGAVVCCFRMLDLADGSLIDTSYAAQYYELSALRAFEGAMVEMGRFCVDPTQSDPDILRLAWAAMTQYVDARGVELLFGCSSFKGVEACAYTNAFALLTARHLAPKRWQPKVKAPKVFKFAQNLRQNPEAQNPDVQNGMREMPPLLKTYLMMGGWVSDHAVVDGDLNTLHVFTGVEIGAIPPERKRLLRAVSG